MKNKIEELRKLFIDIYADEEQEPTYSAINLLCDKFNELLENEPPKLKDYRLLPNKITDEIKEELEKTNIRYGDHIISIRGNLIEMDINNVQFNDYYINVKMINEFYSEVIPKLLELGIIEEVRDGE